MTEHLIITGSHATGKTLLANFFADKINVIVHDGVTKEDILQEISKKDFAVRKLYQNIFVTNIFVTNEEIKYGRRITREKFLIIKLKKVNY